MKIITSLSPKPQRMGRQQFCVQTWLSLGAEVVAVQHSREVAEISSLFPAVTVVADDRSGAEFGLVDSVRIKALLDQITNGAALVVNSDISIKDSRANFQRDWGSPGPKEFRVGLRWNRTPDGKKTLERYGVDTFLFTPELAASFPDIGYSMGSDFWDYFAIWHAIREGYEIWVDPRCALLHEVHERHRNPAVYDRGREIFEEYSGLDGKECSQLVARVTGRTNRKAVLQRKFTARTPGLTKRNRARAARAGEMQWVEPFTVPEDHVPTPTSKRLVIMCACSDAAENEARLSSPFARAYAERCGADFVLLTGNKVPHWPMGNKYRMATFAKHYEQTLCMDADVLVRQDAPDLFDAVDPRAFGVVEETKSLADNEVLDGMKNLDRRIRESQDIPPHRTGKYIAQRFLCAGLMMIPGSLAGHYAPPPTRFPLDHCSEQQWLAITLEYLQLPCQWIPLTLYASGIDIDFWESAAVKPFVHLNGIVRVDRERVMQAWIAGSLSEIDTRTLRFQPPAWSKREFAANHSN